MSHEIEQNDHVVLTREKAWHGLGTIVSDAPNAIEALKIAKLDWQVTKKNIVIDLGDGQTMPLKNKMVNFREDCNQALGVVSKDYEIIQNNTLAEWCDDLVDFSQGVKIETAGSIRNGSKVWFLLQSESFDATGQNDMMQTYLLVSNGHDGRNAMNVIPTSIRVVCANTLHMVLPEQSRGQTKGISLHHFGDVTKRMEELKTVIKRYGMAFNRHKEEIDFLVAKNVDSSLMKQFFMESYVRDFGSVPMDPKTSRDSKRKDKAMEAYQQFEKRFEYEQSIAGSNAWNMFNAYSGFVQHDRTTRRTTVDAVDSSQLFGRNVTMASKAFSLALTI